MKHSQIRGYYFINRYDDSELFVPTGKWSIIVIENDEPRMWLEHKNTFTTVWFEESDLYYKEVYINGC